jgi:LytS/YehU family sensor histidine kinase
MNNDYKIQLLGIRSGKYTLLIEGRNIGSGISYKPLKLDIIIHPPFWKTIWFIVLISSLFIIGIMLFIKKRITLIKKQEQVKKRLAETKLEALQSQMNPHFIFNAMNSIQNYIIDNDINEALMYLGEFSKLIRQTLNNSFKIRITLVEEIDYLESYVKLEKMRFKKPLNFNIKIDSEIDVYEMEIPPMIIQPLIENIFIHAFDSKTKNPLIEISFKMLNNNLTCEIRDNGKGFELDEIGAASKGIKLIKERLNLIQGSEEDNLRITSSLDTGTLIFVKFTSNKS